MKPENPKEQLLDLERLRALVAARGGPEMWRGLEELAETEEFQEALRHEFPWRETEEVEGIDRREFWRLMGASLAMAGLSGCATQPPERIVPYVRQPEGITQGVPLFFATAMPFAGHSLGLLVKSHMGHPIKVEGNPRHPASLGATDPFAQASLMTLYDPDRSPTVVYHGRISNWIAFIGAMSMALEEQRASQGARVRLLTETVISPTLGQQIQAFLNAYPAARWHQYEAVTRDGPRIGSRMAFGQFVNTYYRFDKADVILSADGGFLSCGPAGVRYAHDFSTRRGSRAGSAMNRLYAVESSPSNTGASADHRLRLRPSEMEGFLRGVAQAIGAPGGAAPPEAHAKWISAVAADLQRHPGAAIVVPGDRQPPQLHALAHAMNVALGSAGSTVIHTDPVEVNPVDQMESIRELTREMHAGQVDVLVILGGNPAYDAPADLDFPGALSKVKTRVHLSLYDDETSAHCDWHIPQTHFLEEWGDCLAFDGTASIIQPLIAPLYRGRMALEVMAVLLGQPDAAPYEMVRAYWRARSGTDDFEMFWRRALHDGLVAGTALPARNVAVQSAAVAETSRKEPSPGGPGLEIEFQPDPTIWDGRFANNSYLQELSKPISKLTWDAAALVSPKTAQSIGAYSGGVVRLELHGRSVLFPLWVQPGQADDTITVGLGYGRTRAGRVGNTGYNAYPLRTSDAPWSTAGLQVSKTAEFYRLACTQFHYSMDGRYPVRMGTLQQYLADPEFANKEPFHAPPPPSQTLYPEWRYPGYKWGMAIDLNACVGCKACVVACDLENNIPVVGKQEVLRYRQMHWLRIDRYFHGDMDDPTIWFQPLLCMHCENAPCELVCPVNATVHSAEGLNQMIYNRCVGTRYCSNNCPYKVRRFNYFLYANWHEKPLELMRNPEVTVRSRGVMEKCTYCVQRIESAKIQSEKEGRRIRDGEIQTACQQACPTQAIVFGDLNDKESRAAQLKRQPLNYGLLADLNTRPRTTYLAKLVNLNPELDTKVT
jgi:molybdopterin-containing oxidoreductase family iron-sulfur binding subunit